MNLAKRLLGFLVGLDEATNALGGGSTKQTISGTVGRALEARKWWAPPAAAILDAIFGAGHCERNAAAEANTAPTT